MKNHTSFLCFAVSLFLLTSCVTGTKLENSSNSYLQENDAAYSHSPIDFENEDVKAVLQFDGARWVELFIENKTDNVLQFTTDLSTFTFADGSNTGLIPSGTKFIEAGKSIPPFVIAPKSKFQKSFSAVDAIGYLEVSGWYSADWLPESLKGTNFIFSYKFDGVDKYIVFQGDKSQSTQPPSPPPQKTALGNVRADKRFWNVLFLKSVEKRRKILFDEAMVEAKRKYGENIDLKNLRYEGVWNPASLLFYFSMLGFVEDASLTADVFTK